MVFESLHLDDPRPEDMAELARLTAKEPRKRGIWASDDFTNVMVAHGDTRRMWPYSVQFTQFDNLGPIACADVIQAEEASRAQEWAGDEQ